MDKFIVQYSGNMGRTHDIETIVAAARRLRDEHSIHFLFIGSGAKRARLEREVHSLGNVTVLGPQPRDKLCDSLNASDVSIISFAAGMAGISVPSRMYNALAAGKPLIAVADGHSELAMVVQEERVGWIVRPADTEALVRVILDASANKRGIEEAGSRARALVEQKYRYDLVIKSYRVLIDELRSDSANQSDSHLLD